MRLPARSRLALVSRVRTGRVALAVLLAALGLAGCARAQPAPSAVAPAPSASAPPLSVRVVGEVVLPGDNSRFDYANLDVAHGLLFVAHLGAGEVVEVDVRAHRVVRVIPDVSQVHGVLVVPALHRVFATATGENRLVALDEDSGAVLWRSPTGDYPDGLAYDPVRAAIWTTNESAGSETVIDANNGTVRGQVELGGEVGNVAYDPTSDRMVVDVQETNELAVIDPTGLKVERRVSLPGCAHDHGLSLAPADRLAFVACDHNAALLTVDLANGQIVDVNQVGPEPDVLAYDPNAHRLYVAAESGVVSVLELAGRRTRLLGSGHLADGAHVVAVDPSTGHSYYPIPGDANGRPALLEATP